jgi:hypothetical protein
MTWITTQPPNRRSTGPVERGMNANTTTRRARVAALLTTVLAISIAGAGTFATPVGGQLRGRGGEIEAALRAHPEVVSAAVQVRDGPRASYPPSVELSLDLAEGVPAERGAAVVREAAGLLLDGRPGAERTLTVACGPGRPSVFTAVGDPAVGDVERVARGWLRLDRPAEARLAGDRLELTVHRDPATPDELGAALTALAAADTSGRPSVWTVVLGTAGTYRSETGAPPVAVAAVLQTLAGLPAAGAGEVASTAISWRNRPEGRYLAAEVQLPPVLLRHGVPGGNPAERTATAYRAALDASGVPYTLSVRVADHPPFLDVDHR